MTRKLQVVVLPLCLFLTACFGPTQVSKVDAAYMQRLNARLAQYKQTSAAADADFTQRTNAVNAQAAKAADAPISAADQAAIAQDIFQYIEAEARADTLSHFIQEAAVSGQVGFMTSWISSQATRWGAYTQQTTDDVTAYDRDSKANPQSITPDRYSKVVFEVAGMQGIAEELAALNSDVQGYAKDYQNAAAIDAQRQEIAVRLAQAYLSAPRINVQPPPAAVFVPGMPMMPMQTMCMNMGMFTHCTTN